MTNSLGKETPMQGGINMKWFSLVVVSVSWPVAAEAQWSMYGGFDMVNTASVVNATNSLQAEAAWINAAGAIDTIHTVDFETLTLGDSGWLHTIAPGVRMMVRGGAFADDLTVSNGPTAGYSSINGFNSTQGGSQHMRYTSYPGSVGRQPTVVFLFDQPISALSTFITGQGTGSTFDFFQSTTIHAYGTVNRQMGIGDLGNPYWPSTQQPNVRFGGFVDGSESFTRVEVRLRWYSSGQDTPWRGSFSLDDVRWVYAPIPAPGTVAVFAIVPLLCCHRRHRT